MIRFKVENQQVHLEGELSFSTVLSVRQDGLDYVAQVTQPAFNFSAVTKVDSAGVALLLEWWRLAVQSHKKIQFLELPHAMQALMKVSNLTEVLM